jgi:hypothetical protein
MEGAAAAGDPSVSRADLAGAAKEFERLGRGAGWLLSCGAPRADRDTLRDAATAAAAKQFPGLDAATQFDKGQREGNVDGRLWAHWARGASHDLPVTCGAAIGAAQAEALALRTDGAVVDRAPLPPSADIDQVFAFGRDVGLAQRCNESAQDAATIGALALHAYRPPGVPAALIHAIYTEGIDVSLTIGGNCKGLQELLAADLRVAMAKEKLTTLNERIARGQLSL